MKWPFTIWTRLVALLYALFLGVVYWQCGSISPVFWWIGAAFIGFIETYVGWWIPVLSAQKRKRKSILEDARQVIVSERKNFGQIQNAQENGKSFSGRHQKAVEVFSFEITGQAMDQLAQYRIYRKPARRAVREIQINQGKKLDDMNVAELQEVLDILLLKLNAELVED